MTTEVLYRSHFNLDDLQDRFFTSTCCPDYGFDVIYGDKLLILGCFNCNKEFARLAVQDPLWEPDFKYESVFLYSDGKFHFLLMPNEIEYPEESKEFNDKAKRQKYRLAFAARSNSQTSVSMRRLT